MVRTRGIPAGHRAWLILLPMALAIALALVPRAAMATPPMEDMWETSQEVDVARKAGEGDYDGAFNEILHPAFPRIYVNYAHAAKMLERGCELLIYLNSKAQFDARMPGLQEVRAKVEKAKPWPQPFVAICEHALAKHERAKLAQAQVLVPPPTVQAVQQRMAGIEKMTSPDADSLFDQIVAIRDNDAAIELATAVIARMEKYAAMPAKYHRVAGAARLVSRLTEDNPLRARDLARIVLAEVRGDTFSPETELAPSQQPEFDQDLTVAIRARADRRLSREAPTPQIDPALRQQLIDLLAQFDSFVTHGRKEQAAQLIHPDSRIKTKILEALTTQSFTEFTHGKFSTFELASNGATVSVDCTITAVTTSDPPKTHSGATLVVFRRFRDTWLIDSL